MKVFLDTNILLDLILKREGCNEAIVILNAIELKLFDGFILDITVLNIDYIAKAQVKHIRDFLRLVNDTITVLGGNNQTIRDALSIKNLDLEDNMQYISAKNLACDMIVTNDMSFYGGDIDQYSSAEFVDKYI
ncbi:MAG TPA: PIN domain-containing protein [Sulfurovum sp.]|nr:PIN domain-containing protein [Sulfurovum sp.]